MSDSITILGSHYTVKGTVTNQNTDPKEGIADLHVLAYDKDLIGKNDFLGIGVTDATGAFSIKFDRSKFSNLFDRRPDLYFIVKDAGLELLDTKDNVIKNATEETPPINLEVSILNDKLRADINETPAEGWVGGFVDTNSEYAYPKPNLAPMGDLLGNMENINKLDRQQKVLWPEFSWESEPDKENKAARKRCFQMFAPDISRLGYTNKGHVYSIICPQQGFSSPSLGNLNVEVTVTGNRGWADEENRTLAADMSVVGKIWFSPSAHENPLLKLLLTHFNKQNLPFPKNKENAIVVKTYMPGNPDQVWFPLTKGLTPEEDFIIPEFAKHEGVYWAVGHLGVEIGSIEKTGVKKVDDFNHLIMEIFNMVSGNMLKEGNILTWNVWFTAPEVVDREEWQNHAEKWRESLEADHGSPDGEGTIARHFDGTPFEPVKELIKDEMPKILAYIKEHVG